MKTPDLLLMLAAGAAVFLLLPRAKAAPANAAATESGRRVLNLIGLPDLSGLVATQVYGSPLMHPADAYAGTWTANGPLVPGAYDKQIWD